MSNTTNTGYPVLHKGALKEEVWEWADLEAAASEGRLAPESMIFFPNDNVWKKAVDTELAGCFDEVAPAEPGREFESEYQDALADISENPADNGPHLHAAEIALAMGDRDAARNHYQRALELTPFHPRVAQEAKRNLPPRELKTLRLLQKPPHVWEEPLNLALYPVKRGPLYLLIPVLAVFAMSWSIWTLIPCLFLLGLGTMESMAAASKGSLEPPLPRGSVLESGLTAAKRLIALLGVALELYLPFAAIAVVLMATGQTSQSNAIDVVGKSPILAVVVFTTSMVYLPAALMLAAEARTRLRDVLNPLYVGSIIRLMEVEYIVAIGFVLVMSGVIWGLGKPLGAIPVVPKFFYAFAAVYTLLAAGLVFGRLIARFREQIEYAGIQDSTGS